MANGSDSRVAIGCWAKGRSSSYLLNGVLRATMGSNVADDPSRFKVVRKPAPCPAWLAQHILELRSPVDTTS
eukprot:12342050-Heterocapsa_arctica.AAC.1